MPITKADFINAALAGLKQEVEWGKTHSFTAVAGAIFSLFAQAGTPGAGTETGTALTPVAQSDATTGALSTITDASGGRSLWLHWLEALVSGQPGTIEIWDRLLQIPGFNHATTSAQTVLSGDTLPRYTTGEGVQAFLVVTTGLNATAHNVTIGYTNQAGTSGRATTSQAIVASSVASRVPHAVSALPLQGSDRGIRSVQDLTFSASATGTSTLVLAKRLASIWLPGAGQVGTRDLLSGEGPIEIEDGACLMARWIPQTTTASWIAGRCSISQVAAP